MDTSVTIGPMNRKLSSDQIEAVCRELLARQRSVTVRGVMAELRSRYGASGRTNRVTEILRRVERSLPVGASSSDSSEITALRERLQAAEVRAARSEEMERHHQDYWAKRYVEKVDELERKYAALLRSRPAITTDDYLRLQQRVAELTRRLAEYEPPR